MWNRLTEEEWILAIDKLNLPLFYQPNYLKCISSAYKLDINYLSFISKNQSMALLACFSDHKKNIIIPEGFSYTPFYIMMGLSEKPYVEIQHDLISFLKNEFGKIKLKLETKILDVRPFIWEGFEVNVKYTHVKSDFLVKDSTVLKNLGKPIVKEYQFKVEDLNEENLHINLEFLKILGFSLKKVKQHQELMILWANSNYLKAFSVYFENKLVCSNLVLLDFKSANAYTILLNQALSKDKYAHTFLYDQIIKWCSNHKIESVDFCGANFKSISEFKSRFHTDLKMYFVVSYNPIKAGITKLFNKLLN